MGEETLPVNVRPEDSQPSSGTVGIEEVTPPKGPERAVISTRYNRTENDEEDEEDLPPTLVLVAHELLQNADKVEKLVRAFGEQSAKTQKHETLKTLLVAGMFFTFMAIIVASAALLVYSGQMDGNAFSFLIAVVVGSMITFVGSAVFGQIK